MRAMPGWWAVVLWGLLAVLPGPARGEENHAPPGAATYTLRYVFRPGQTMRWDVTHRLSVRTSISDTTQIAETSSTSVKVWRVQQVAADGTATFEHRVEDVDMRQKLTGREEVRYNSRTDKHPPPGFQDVARSLGVTLAVVTLDNKGKLIKRQRLVGKGDANAETQIAIPLPEEAIPVGYTWSRPSQQDVTTPNGLYKKVLTLQRFTLESVKTGVATISVETQILTPIHDPALEAQLIQFGSRGAVRFDVDAGQVLGTQMDLDKQVVGFRGAASSIHYLTRFTERLRSQSTEVAAK